ncbi:uncharacterized protein LOC34623849 [Cyclospora cayetanensis]|uniref:Uncharacterized protein LOC34623849 n=1 Tax=Cyclospora cayetanensis TaxID=88456 RepID=A0A6P6RQT5_9EIME|nr:uncharacterized protein LOC34623849 [Cyclospora cayetanensis]
MQLVEYGRHLSNVLKGKTGHTTLFFRAVLLHMVGGRRIRSTATTGKLRLSTANRQGHICAPDLALSGGAISRCSTEQMESIVGSLEARFLRSCNPARCCPRAPPQLPLALIPFWAAPPPEFSEASLSGEWSLRGKLQDLPEGHTAGTSERDSAAESVRAAAGPRAATDFLRVWDALHSGKHLSLYLSSDRLATLRIPSFCPMVSYTFKGIWQVRRRPLQPPLMEVELGFPPGSPEVILALSAPLKSGSWIPHVPQAGPGEVTISFSPFLPWKSRRVLAVEICPQTNEATVDGLLQ